LLLYCYSEKYIAYICQTKSNHRKMSVKVRKRKNSDGSVSLLLDIYHNGERSYEFLKDLKLLKPASPIDREENKQRLRLAEQIKNKREQQLQSDEYEITPAFKKNINFLEFFAGYLDKYNKKDKRVISACYYKFKEFMADSGLADLTTKQINENLVVDFKEYLENKLNGETPANYFKKFKKILTYGVKQNVFSVNPAIDIIAKRNESIKKDILTFDEIQLLASVSINNDNIKRAFLLSCYTGLRYCDIISLRWKNINDRKLKILQQKTSKPVSINLNDIAMQLLGKAGKVDELVFNLPSHTACLKNLKTWCKKAGINKKITWHCARHSFATGIIFYGSDVNSASSLLGHSSLMYTQRYVRVVEQLKEKAVNNLPEVILQ